MEYNVEKCAVRQALGDLGVIVQDSLKVNVQVQSAVRKANAMLAFMSRGLEYKSRDVLLRLYQALVRPHLEFVSSFGPRI